MYDRLTEVENIYAEPFAAENYLFFAGAQAYPLASRLPKNSTCTCEYFLDESSAFIFFIMSAAERIFPLSLRFGMCIPLFPNNVCSPGNKKNAG